MRTRHCLLAGLLLHAGAALPQAPAEPAPAEQVPPDEVPTIPVAEPAAEPPAAAGTQLDPVVVTAERKVSTLQETPISIEALNAEELSLRGIDGLFGLAANVPNLTIEPFPIHNATLRMFIRGAGTADAQITQDPAVAVYIDGVYIARSVGLAVDTADLERIEVLRGPQGTLYGRNTTGGAINLVTRRPSLDHFTMSHQLTAGQLGQLLGKSSFNVPLTRDLAFKLAVLGSSKDGFMENAGRGGDFDRRRSTAVRADLRWLPTDWLAADYTYDRTDARYYNKQFQNVIPPFTNHGLAEYFKAYAQTQSVYSRRRLDSLATGMPLMENGSWIRGHSLTLTAPFAGLDFKYIGATRRLTDDQYADLGGGAGSTTYRLDTGYYDGPSAALVNNGQPTATFVPRVTQQQTSHEVQVSGTAYETLSFVAGALQFEESGLEWGHPIHHILNSYVDPSQMPPALGAAFAGNAAPMLVAYWDYDLGIRNEARGVFTQLTWSPDYFDRRLHLTAGVRKSWDQRTALKTFAQTIYAEDRANGTATPVPAAATPGNDVFANVRGHRKYDDLSPSANVRYELTPDINVYVSESRAYKSGGFNVRDPQRDADSGTASDNIDYGFGFAEGFRPEYVRSTEVGIKSEWFGRRLRLNADVFNSRLSDMQTNFLIGGSISDTKARNVGKARMRGVEAEATFVALPGLIFNVNGAYLDAKVIECLDINGDNVAHLYPFPSAPPVSGVASVDWTFFERGPFALRAYADYHYMGKRDGVVIVEERRDLTALHPFGLYNARLLATGVHLAGGELEFALWGRNLADKEYPIFAIDNEPSADRAVLWGDPRTFGLDTVYRFY